MPRGGPLAFSFKVDPSSHRPDSIQSTLEALLKSYEGTTYPGSYSLTLRADWWSIEPTRAKTRSGETNAVTPVLSARITIPHDVSLTLSATLEKVLAATSATTGTKIVLGCRLPPQWASSVLGDDIDGKTAREAIGSILDASGSSMSWVLLYDPTFHYYVFTPYST